jgi:hypothetical protein
MADLLEPMISEVVNDMKTLAMEYWRGKMAYVPVCEVLYVNLLFGSWLSLNGVLYQLTQTHFIFVRPQRFKYF